MHRSKRPEAPDPSPGKSGRTYSMSTEASSLPGSVIVCPPASVSPDPVYVAISAASLLVSAALETDGVTIAPSALAQLNGFLDYVLFNILLTARSTKLSLLRPAVYNVLKAKLGKAALVGADEELQELLADGEAEDEEDGQGFEAEQMPAMKGDFDLELAWKLARLRCMVFCRLGDLEEDDEDRYIERDNLDERGGRPRRYSRHPSRVPAPSAIFLTSVVEFIAEQALAYATEATHRKLAKSQAVRGAPDPLASSFFPPDRVVVSDADMRHLGRESPLQKLWRGWRHQVRPSADPASRPLSPESLMVIGHSRKTSFNAADETPASEMQKHMSVEEVLQETDPAWIPLPMTENDVNEIEMPESTSTHDHEPADQHARSLDHEGSGKQRALVSRPSRNQSDALETLDRARALPRAESTRHGFWHRRSRSLPNPRASPLPDTSHLITANQPTTLTPSFGSRPIADTERVMGDTSKDTQMDAEAVPIPGDAEDGPGESRAAAATMPGPYAHGHMRDIVGALRHDGGDEEEQPSTMQERGLTARPSTSPSTRTPESAATEPALLSRTHPLRSLSRARTVENGYEEEEGSTHPTAAKPEPSDAAPEISTPPPLPPFSDMRRDGSGRAGKTSPISPTRDPQKRQGQVVFPLEPRSVRRSSKSSDLTKSSSSSSKLLGFDREQQKAMQAGSMAGTLGRPDPETGFQDGSDPNASLDTSDSTQEKSAAVMYHPPYAAQQVSSRDASPLAKPSDGRATRTGKQQIDQPDNAGGSMPSNKPTKSTPVSAREGPVKGSTLIPRKTATQEMADFFRDTAPPGYERTSGSGGRSMNGLRANPPETTALPRIVPQAVAPSRMGRSRYQPREATIENPHTRDLADFAKSTGPDDPAQLPKILSTVSAQPKRTRSAIQRSQARDPVIKGSNSDLIDFIREGPPRGVGDDPRIPRTVAPFRTTMDSDELTSLGGPSHDHGGRNSGSSNHDGSIVTKSTVNSRTGLVDPTGRIGVNPSNASHAGVSQLPRRLGGEPLPARGRQRRARDPYAIDLDSDEEMEYEQRRPQREGEESLIDFLRNTSPPRGSQQPPQPLSLSSNPIPAQAPGMLRKPASGGFRDRLKRTASTHSLHRAGGTTPSVAASERTNSLVRSRTPNRAGSPHLTQSGSRFNANQSHSQTTYAAHVDRNRRPGTLPRNGEDRDEGGLSKFFSRKRRVAT